MPPKTTDLKAYLIEQARLRKEGLSQLERLRKALQSSTQDQPRTSDLFRRVGEVRPVVASR